MMKRKVLFPNKLCQIKRKGKKIQRLKEFVLKEEEEKDFEKDKEEENEEEDYEEDNEEDYEEEKLKKKGVKKEEKEEKEEEEDEEEEEDYREKNKKEESWNNKKLYDACKNGNIQLIYLIIDNSIKYNLQLDWGSGLDSACEVGQMEAAKLMIKQLRKKFDTRICLCHTLFLAGKSGNIFLMLLLMDVGRRDNLFIYWNYALMGACQYGQVQMVKLLFEESQKYNIQFDWVRALTKINVKLAIFLNYFGFDNRKIIHTFMYVNCGWGSQRFRNNKIFLQVLNRRIRGYGQKGICIKDYENGSVDRLIGPILERRYKKQKMIHIFLKRYFPSLFLKCIIFPFVCYDFVCYGKNLYFL